MTSFIDTHCHLDRLEPPPAQSIADAQSVGVQTLMTISVNRETLAWVDAQSQAHPDVYGSLGIHPHDAAEYGPEVAEQIRTRCAHNPKVRAIGETGLDYHYHYADRATQLEAFRAQLELAEELGLPVVLHTREAEADTLEVLQQHPVSQRGVAHSFTGSLEMAQTLVDMGWYIGLNGILTFKNAEALRDVARNLPLDSLLLETDAPFLAPVPFRGKPNAPARIPVIADYLAQLLDISLEQLAEQTNRNAQTLFGFAPSGVLNPENVRSPLSS